MSAIPFTERKTALRGVLDLISGCYPRFLFGTSLGGLVPVFHFHDIDAVGLEPYLRYLVDNGYHTVTSEALGAFVREGKHPGEKTVVLCFDDAWKSLSTTVAPLLEKYGLSAIAYAISGRMDSGNAGSEAFAGWDDLVKVQESGVIDIQAHTYSHASVYCHEALAGFVTPETDMPLLSWPALKLGDKPTFLSKDMLGCPYYVQRSRYSDATRYLDPVAVRESCMERVAAGGGKAFFEDPSWEKALRGITRDARGRFESPEERRKEMREELTRSKEVLESRLKTRIRQVCFPWGVCGSEAEALAKEAGYETAVADRLFGIRGAVAKGNPYRIMRLKHQFIPALPGRERRSFFQIHFGHR